jgi:DNA-binding winged helix-turn-helix (wHTH) protein
VLDAAFRDVLCFDDYRLDLQRRLLFEKSVVVRIPSKVFDIIAFLASRPENVVTKDELAKQLWPGSEIGDSNIGQHVYLARKALRDIKKPHRYIATAHGVGYCFTAEVSYQPRTVEPLVRRVSHTRSLDALHLYKSARYFADFRTRAGLESSLDFFGRAIQLEPGFSKAYAGRAFSHLLIATSYFAEPRVHFAAAIRDAREAQLRDDGEPLPYVILAAVSLLANGDVPSCDELLDDALRLRRDFVPAHVVRCLLGITRNQFDEATKAAETIVRIRGARGGADAYLGIVSFFAGNSADAAAYLHEVVALHPHVAHARLFLGMAQLRIGHLDEAARAFRYLFEDETQLNTGGPDFRAHALAYATCCAVRAANEIQAARAVKRLDVLRTPFVSPVARAVAHSALGDGRRVAAALREAAELQDPWFTFTPYIPELC